MSALISEPCTLAPASQRTPACGRSATRWWTLPGHSASPTPTSVRARRPPAQSRTVIESWWSQFASECQRLCHPPRLNHRLLIAHGRAPPAGCLRQGYLLPKPLRNCATVPCAGPFRQFPAARGGGAQAGAGAGAAGAGDWRRKLPAASGLVRLQTLPGGAEHAPPVVSTGAGGDHGIDDDQNWLRFSYDSTFGRSHYLHPHPYDSAGIGRLE
jgi:hypothetical protein